MKSDLNINNSVTPVINPLISKPAWKEQPKRCRWFWDIRIFVAGSSLLLLSQMVCHVYYVGVVRTIERRFGLTSKETGFINSCNDIMTIAVVIAIGYFGGKSNKPRVISVFCTVFAIGSMLFASPYFLFPAIKLDFDPEENHTISNTSLCSQDSRSDLLAGISANRYGYWTFVLAQFFIGFGGTANYILGLSYIDENSSKAKSPIYMGILISMFSFGPMAAHLLAAFTTGLPEDIFSATKLTPDDPKWIGCWWLGFLIVAFIILLLCIPMFFFPPRLLCDDNSNGTSDGTSEVTEQSFLTQIKEFPKAVSSLLTNVPFMLRLASITTGVHIYTGIFANVPRFLEIHYHLPTFKANSYSALHSFAGFAGGLSGGVLVSKLRMTSTGAVKFMIWMSLAMLCGFGAVSAFSCPQENMHGDWSDNKQTLLVQNSCNDGYSCNEDSSHYDPVCSTSDGISYFSSCHAGCPYSSNSTFLDCRCTPSGTVTKGYCVQGCDMLLPYLVVFFITCIAGAMRHVPSLVVQFRVVKPDEKSLSISLNSFCNNLLGFIPGPIIFGSLIDSTCLLWQESCGERGACLLFNIAQFRIRTYGTSLMFLVISTMFSVALWRAIRKRHAACVGGDVIITTDVKVADGCDYETYTRDSAL